MKTMSPNDLTKAVLDLDRRLWKIEKVMNDVGNTLEAYVKLKEFKGFTK